MDVVFVVPVVHFWTRPKINCLKRDPLYKDFFNAVIIYVKLILRWTWCLWCPWCISLAPAWKTEVHSDRVNFRVSRRQVTVSFASMVAVQASHCRYHIVYGGALQLVTWFPVHEQQRTRYSIYIQRVWVSDLS